MLQITVLGCGSSLGMPIINCDCNICTSTSSYNKRTRSSIYIDDGNSQILVDFGFDIKNQLMREKIKKLDGAILTHYLMQIMLTVLMSYVYFYFSKKYH